MGHSNLHGGEQSPIPAITDEELRRHVVATRRDVIEIKTALMGNQLGTEGVIPRLIKVERRVDTHDRKLITWTGILVAAGAVIVFLKDILVIKSFK